MGLIVDRVADHCFVGSWLGSDSVVVDLGMNIGNFSYEIQRRYGCRIAGVEANPALAGAIVRNDRLNCTNIAIAERPGPVEFFIDQCDSKASSTFPQDDSNPELQRVVVEGNTFESFVAAEHLQRIDLLKIDIEGAELYLLEQTPDEVLREVRQMSVEFHAFIRPQDLPRIKTIVSGMRQRNFFVLDFSVDLSNVLMINKRYNRLKTSDRVALHVNRIAEGLKRIVKRRRWRKV